MAGFIPDEIVDRVRSATDIVDLVSEYVSLKKSGANYLGLCPFHDEKTPSFTVSPSKQIYHCFGCGAGGDAVGFLIRHDNYTFPEAIRRLADRAGIEIPETGRTARRDRGELEAIQKANEAAAAFFVRCLWESREGEKARRYLEGRGISAELAREFSMGYSMPSWDWLLVHLKKKGVGPELAEKAGLALPRSSGQGRYDRFRDRLMFAIADVRGRVIGFGGRALDDSEPKYLNSPETPLFKKGETLYLADVAGGHIRKRGYAIVTEGYFDAIACHSAGAKNAVATLGTALTPMHLRLLRRFSKNVLVVFDSDAAGIKAAERSLDVFLPTGMTAKVALLPAGDDPDSLVAREGAKGLKDWLGKSERLLDFVIGMTAKGARTLDEKVAAAAKVTGVLAKIPNAVERSQYLKVAAELLGVREDALAEELDKALGRAMRGPGGPGGLRPKKRPAGASARIEEELIHLALRFPDAALELKENIGPDDFTDPKMKRVAEKVLGQVSEGGAIDVPRLLDTLEEEEDRALVQSLSLRQDEYERPTDTAAGTLERLYRERLEAAAAEITGMLDTAQASGDDELCGLLMKANERLRKMKSDTKTKDFAYLNKLHKELPEYGKRRKA